MLLIVLTVYIVVKGDSTLLAVHENFALPTWFIFGKQNSLIYYPYQVIYMNDFW